MSFIKNLLLPGRKENLRSEKNLEVLKIQRTQSEKNLKLLKISFFSSVFIQILVFLFHKS